MSFSKTYYLEREETFQDEKCLRSYLENDFKRNVTAKAVDEFFKGFTPLERRILKRLISTKEPARKIIKRFKLPSEKLLVLLLKASRERDRIRAAEVNRPDLLSVKRPRYGCGHPVKAGEKNDCPACVAVELSESRKQSKSLPVVRNLHKGDLSDL